MKKIIKTNKAPKPIGPYNQAVLAGNYLFISGQIALDSNTGDLITNNIVDETKQVMENLKAILNEASLSFENVVKTTIFLSSMNDFKSVNDVYGSYLSDDSAPARETVEVSKLPVGVNVEISMIAIL
ncbi:MAG: reactive intermediate/imine deaminase [Flavobacteriaceae bacterium]|nr:reactive intermediate/imine deaminase [Flavobacteriaceae bacterium]|tara:strand:+ start:13634 stop:14014 length:381 start_codon:yes stop_codon:yes gene_type:complete